MALSGVFPVSMTGARFEETSTTALFPVGTTCIDNLGGQWLYVKAAEILTVYSLCHVTNASIILGTWLAEMTEITDINTGPKFLGLNQVAFAASDYGWIARGPGGGLGRGIKVRSQNATAGALLHPLSGTAGAVDDANVDEGVLAGLTTLVTTTTIANTEVQMTTILTCNLTEVD
ncbi:MAG TPA: hypothetical protein PLJ74_05410 [Myxococcota bacterium]|nr:hypothetical protein [Myxococcota bacterium]